MTGTASTGATGGGPKRIWLVVVLLGLASSAVLATIVILATRSSTAETDARPTVAIGAEGPVEASAVAGEVTLTGS